MCSVKGFSLLECSIYMLGSAFLLLVWHTFLLQHLQRSEHLGDAIEAHLFLEALYDRLSSDIKHAARYDLRAPGYLLCVGENYSCDWFLRGTKLFRSHRSFDRSLARWSPYTKKVFAAPMQEFILHPVVQGGSMTLSCRLTYGDVTLERLLPVCKGV